MRAAALPVHHLAVVVGDLARAEQFYAGVLGLPVSRRWADDEGAPRSVWLTLGGEAFLAIERLPPSVREGAGDLQPGGLRAPTPGWHCVALAIDAAEREEWRARLAEAGFPVETESAFTLYVRDPEENLVALSHYPKPAKSTGSA